MSKARDDYMREVETKAKDGFQPRIRHKKCK